MRYMATFNDSDATRKPIIILYSCGTHPNQIWCRHIINVGLERNTTEKLSKDGLGRPTWVPVDGVRGLPDTSILIQRAFRLIFDNAPAANGLRLWPEGVTKTDDGFEINLGVIK